MRRISERSFEGPAGELVSVRVTTAGTAGTCIWLDGKPVASGFEFPMQGTRRVAVLLAGEPGEKAVVAVSTAAGVALTDVVLVTPHDPFPIQHYGFKAL